MKKVYHGLVELSGEGVARVQVLLGAKNDHNDADEKRQDVPAIAGKSETEENVADALKRLLLQPRRGRQ